MNRSINFPTKLFLQLDTIFMHFPQIRFLLSVASDLNIASNATLLKCTSYSIQMSRETLVTHTHISVFTLI